MTSPARTPVLGARLVRAVIDTGRGTRRIQRVEREASAGTPGAPRAPRGIFDPALLRAARPSGPPEVRPARALQEPGHVRRRGDRRPRHAGLPGGPHGHHDRDLGRGRAIPGLRAPDRGLALVHGLLRDVRGGARRGAWQGPGRVAAQDALGDRGSPPARRRHGRGHRLVAPPLRGPHRGPRRRDDPGRWRRDPGRGLRQRSRHHRRVRPGPQGAGHGHPELGDRRHHDHERLADRTHHGEPGRDLPRPHDRARRGREATADAQRDRALHPPVRADDRLPARDGDDPAVRPLCARPAGSGRPRRSARLPDPDDDRGPSLRDRHRRHGPRRALQRPRDERSCRGGVGRRGCDPARQDGHDHLRQPAGVAHRGPAGGRRARRRRGGPPHLARGRDARGPLDRGAGTDPAGGAGGRLRALARRPRQPARRSPRSFPSRPSRGPAG